MARVLARLLPARYLAHPDAFEVWQARGVHVTPVHPHQPVPDTRLLGEELWERESELVGIDLREDAQLRRLDEFEQRFRTEYLELGDDPAANAFPHGNGYFEGVDAEVLWCMVRSFRPARVLEIGGGYSTRILRAALERNGAGVLTTIEPEPSQRLPSGGEVIASRVQEVDQTLFDELGENDILFVDSSHVLATGSDVQHLYNDVIPRLRPGVVVHAHDVFFPTHYPREWLFDVLRLSGRYFWNEQYVVQAFLAFNSAFEVLWSSNWLARRYPERIARAFPSLALTTVAVPSSLWFRRRSGT